MGGYFDHHVLILPEAGLEADLNQDRGAPLATIVCLPELFDLFALESPAAAASMWCSAVGEIKKERLMVLESDERQSSGWGVMFAYIQSADVTKKRRSDSGYRLRKRNSISPCLPKMRGWLDSWGWNCTNRKKAREAKRGARKWFHRLDRAWQKILISDELEGISHVE